MILMDMAVRASTIFRDLISIEYFSLAGFGTVYGPGIPVGPTYTGYVTTAISPALPIVSPGRPYGGGFGLGAGLGGFGSIPPKIRAIFIPQGGCGGAPMNPW